MLYFVSDCRECPLIHLNYAVFLVNNGDNSAATRQLKFYNTTLRNHKPLNPDPEVYLDQLLKNTLYTCICADVRAGK